MQGSTVEALNKWGSFSSPSMAWLLEGSVSYYLSRSEVRTPARQPMNAGTGLAPQTLNPGGCERGLPTGCCPKSQQLVRTDGFSGVKVHPKW